MLLVILRNFIRRYILRIQCRDLHSHILKSFFHSISIAVCLSLNKHADLTACMNVGYYNAVLGYDLLESPDVHILTDLSDHSCKLVRNSHRRIKRPWLCFECLDISRLCISRLFYYFFYIIPEYFILCNEVCLCIYLYDRSYFISVFDRC